MDTIIVTGGAGYVGSHAAKRLAEAGYRPVVVDNLSTGHEWAVQWGPLEVGDIGDTAFMTDVFNRYRPAAVMHFSAASLVGESVVAPAEYYENNVFATFRLLEAMKACGIRRFVFSSTCAVYGLPETVPITEAEHRAPINPYGATKLAVEQMMEAFAEAYGLSGVALRYFNAAGADTDARIGEAHRTETHLIPLCIDAAMGRRGALKVFGTDYDTRDGTCIRDYIHVDDLADAHLLALDRTAADRPGFDAYNLGNGLGYTVREVIETVERLGGQRVPAVDAPRRAGDPPMLVADARKARDDLGWRPQRASLDIIIASALQWHQAQQSGAVVAAQ